MALAAEKVNYFMTSLRGYNETTVQIENSMHNYNATLVLDITHWGVSAVDLYFSQSQCIDRWKFYHFMKN